MKNNLPSKEETTYECSNVRPPREVHRRLLLHNVPNGTHAI